MEVNLKCLQNFDNIDKFLIEANEYSINKHTLKIYGISQNPETKNYFMVLQSGFCEKCGELYTNVKHKWCKSCQINELKKSSLFHRNEDKKIDDFIKEMQSRIDKWNDIVFEWIPYDHFIGIRKIGEGGFATVYSAKWKDGPLKYNTNEKKYERVYLAPGVNDFVLKVLIGSQNNIDGFLNVVKAYSISTNMFNGNILAIYGITQDPVTKDYIIILDHAKGGSFNDWIKNNNYYITWKNKLHILHNIIGGLKEIHENKLIHRDFHTGNILFDYPKYKKDISVCISDMGLCGEVNNVDETKIYGVLPYVAPEVLRGKPYTQAADIYSFGMIMYFVATLRQPFFNCGHDLKLTLDICNGVRPEVNELDAPDYFVGLMKRCWDSNPDNRPNAIEIYKLISSFKKNNRFKESKNYNLTVHPQNHPQAIYTSRLLNPYMDNLSKTDCIDCVIVD
ncbi:kinase-like domain-containing protein [Rhizophagus clarus]|nr:kinase-like domain-containing protein [Rhizophagus clarus]